MCFHLLDSSLPDAPAYGGNSVYLFSTLDGPTEESLRTPSPILSPNSKSRKTSDDSPSARPDDPTTRDAPSDHGDVQMDESSDREEREEEEEEVEEDDAEAKYSGVPLVLPRRSFKGVSNLQTIKDGTMFLGLREILVTNGEIFHSKLCRAQR